MAKKKTQPSLLTIQQAADYLQSSRQAVWAAIDKERLPAAQYGRIYLISRSALDAYKKTRRPGGPPSKRKPAKR